MLDLAGESGATLKARWVFPVEGPPLADGMVTIRGERIVAVGQNLSGPPTQDLGNVAILPGLVNCHTHLEFSGLERPLGAPGMIFPDWIRRVVAHRRAPGPAILPQAAVEQGLAECHRTGTTTLGEIASSDWFLSYEGKPPLDMTVFFELIGLKATRIEPALEQAREVLSATGAWRMGLSPHAPYTVHPELFAKLVALAIEKQAPLAFHLAESREELELLRSRSGPFLKLLQELDAWDETAIPQGTRPMDYLRVLATAPRALVIHGNYLDTEEIEFLATHKECMAVVYCPRTHAYFAHARHPLQQMLAAGVRVGLGTDSRSSNPDLNLLEEMRLVARRFPSLPAADVLKLGTIDGARALGCEQECGSLVAGKLANLAVVKLPARDVKDPHELLFDSSEAVVETVCRGRTL
jgi:cytosine/adenosine deaminase-related metal-dependent hydrolase